MLFRSCQQAKAPRHARFGLLNPLQVPYTAWASTSVDFITQLPKLAEYTQIMVVVDRFTKMAHLSDYKKMRLLKMWQKPSSRKYGNSTDYHRILSQTWTRNLQENSGNHYAKNSELKERCQQPTILKLTDKPRESTRFSEDISEYL